MHPISKEWLGVTGAAKFEATDEDKGLVDLDYNSDADLLSEEPGSAPPPPVMPPFLKMRSTPYAKEPENL